MNQMRTAFVVVITLCLGVLLGTPQKSDQGEVLLQKAIHKETVEGKLEEAIQIYKEVYTTSKNNRGLAARALVQMGQCYEKLGNAEARKAYEQVIKDFADQEEQAQAARTKLAALTAPGAKPKFTKIRVPTKLPFFTAITLSPDGQQLAYVGDGSVWVVPVHGPSDPEIAGPPRKITERIQAELTTTDIVWSQDGKWIALNVYERLKDGSEESVIYMVPSTGGPLRKVDLEIKNRAEHYTDNALSLSPDGGWLAYTTWKEGEDASKRSVYLAPTKGGPARALTRQGSSEPAFSPDGKKIAYSAWTKGYEKDPDHLWPQQVWVTSIDGGDPIRVYQSPPSDRIRGPIWSPDGKILALVTGTALHSGCEEVVFVQVGADGRPVGSPAKMKLTEATYDKLCGWGTDNKIGVVLSSAELFALYSVSASGGKAVQLTPKDAMLPSWAPDGKRIYFDGCNLGECGEIEYVPSSGGKVTRIPVRSKHRYVVSHPTGSVSVSPDGRLILFAGGYIGKGADRNAHIFTVPVDGGDLTEIMTGMESVSQPCWSPDGKSIAFIGGEETPKKDVVLYQIYIIPAAGGKPRQLTSTGDRVDETKIAWSPDGKQIAYYSLDNDLRLVPLDGGPSRALLKDLKGRLRYFGIAWSPDGKQLAYESDERLFRLNMETGKSEEVQTGLDAIPFHVSWSPDGKTLALMAYQGGEPELCLMSDFLSLLKSRR
jgi:Tol biopolymer transport system component